jgi:hypothetical protein
MTLFCSELGYAVAIVWDGKKRIADTGRLNAQSMHLSLMKVER